MSSVDIVLLAVDWQPRALIRAQLIEAGFEVVATDNWSTMRRHLRPGVKPRLALVDLKGLQTPREILTDLRVLMKTNCVVVLTAIGTTSPEEVRRRGFHVLSRPIAIQDIVRTVLSLIPLVTRLQPASAPS